MRRAKRSAIDPASDPPVGRAGCALLIFRLARATGYRLGEALASLGMRMHEFAVLQHLREAGPISQQGLASALRINPSNLVGLLDELEADGLIVRPRDPADRRRHLVDLTASGRRRLEEARRAAEAAELELLAPLAEAERERFNRALARLTEHACQASRSRGC